ncbi:Zfp36 [Symbiodinium sp. CCMP2592]|nr:Zfp36 [Symbiodinium sp. CCMP2592]
MSPPQKDTHEILERTRMCKYWKAKRCTLGADCKFAHSVAELKQQPDLVATQLCFQFSRKGRCKNGEACKFAHGRSELRRFPNASGNETATKAQKEQSVRKESHENPSIIPPVLQPSGKILRAGGEIAGLPARALARNMSPLRAYSQVFLVF